MHGTEDEYRELSERFEAQRGHVRAMAYPILGTRREAEEAVRETWLRLSRSGASGIEDLKAWLTAEVARVCMDRLRTRGRRGEATTLPQALEKARQQAVEEAMSEPDPDGGTLLADAAGRTLLAGLERLKPDSRIIFVLRDLGEVPYEEIAAILRFEVAEVRLLASRARSRVRGGASRPGTPDLRRQREMAEAFLAASRAGDSDGLLALLDAAAVAQADPLAARMVGARRLRGAAAIAEHFARRAVAAQPALIERSVGLAWAPGRKPRLVYRFHWSGGKIALIEMMAGAERLGRLELSLL